MTRWIEGKMTLVSQEGMEVLGRGDGGPASRGGLVPGNNQESKVATRPSDKADFTAEKIT